MRSGLRLVIAFWGPGLARKFGMSKQIHHASIVQKLLVEPAAHGLMGLCSRVEGPGLCDKDRNLEARVFGKLETERLEVGAERKSRHVVDSRWARGHRRNKD